MILAVASGKGGTGKTTVAASLAAVWPGPVTAVDLDVEEPNLHLFLSPEISGGKAAVLEVPLADEALCTRCGACSELCQYKAISLMGEVLLIFPEMCHGCGGCLALCPSGALSAGSRELGEICWGASGGIPFVMGRLRVGEAMSPPLMRQVTETLGGMLAEAPSDVILDCPPGVSCPAMTAVGNSDAILLVTEPTPFGFYDFRLAWEAFSPLDKPMGVVINRAGVGTDEVYAFCREKELPILAEIPYARSIAEAYSRGVVLARDSEALFRTFQDLAYKSRGLVKEKEAALA